MAITRRQFIGTSGLMLAAPQASSAAISNTAASFAALPSEGKLILHWYIFGPAWEIEEARRQLRLMREQHVGGVLIFPTYPIAVDDPGKGIHNQNFLSEEFLRVLRAVVEDARSLGMMVDIVAGTGWPFGGPSVALKDSAQMIRRAVLGPDAPLPVLAAGEELIHVHRDPKTNEQLVFTSAPTRMQVKRASAGADGLCVDHLNEAALRRYLDEVGGKLLSAVPANSVRSLFCDSLEVYRSCWTTGFLDIFQRRRGYDLKPHLAALFDERHPDVRDLRHDFWRTISEQAVEAFMKPLQEWAHAHKVQTMVEAYGSPPLNLTGYRYTDIPCGEHYEWKHFNTSRWASSGAHLAGKNLIMAEGWTWTGMPNRFADTLEQLKLCSDLHFLSGINGLYGLTYGYSPVALGSPGWPPYFGPVMNHTIPAWPLVKHLSDYVNRVSFVLQQGKPITDVALYLSTEDAMANANTEQLMLNWTTRDHMASNGTPPEFRLRNALHYEANVVKTIITNGYAFDGVDTFAFNDGMRIENGRLRQGDGDYGILVLPNLVGIDVASLEKIKQFVEQGGLVIATRRLPSTSRGMRNREQDRARVSALVGEIFGKVPRGAGMRVNRLGKGQAVFCGDEQATLRAALQLRSPDITFTEASEHVSFVHRRTADADFYFLANTSESPQRLDAAFRVGHATPQSWNPQTGEVAAVPVYQHLRESTRLVLTLGPRESRIIVFARSTTPPAILSTNLPHVETEGASWTAHVTENGSYTVETVAGRREIVVANLPAPTALNTEWRLRFEGSNIAPIRMAKLQSWTELENAKYFSGRGIYETEFELRDPGEFGCVLDLGNVRETAEVTLNDAPAGVAWMRPYRLDVTRFLKRGRNRLRVDVTNLLINKVLGQGPIDYSEVFARYGQRFSGGDEWDFVREPSPSGLLGPARLVFYRVIRGS